ncbi:MAG: RHS repeat-associated core domain-containing protein [Prevotella sp.]|nr:RHS repeat-associated core domain-containing protein [Prevotella sp.]
MKRLFVAILLCFPLHTLAQSTGQNYVMTETMLNNGGNSKVTTVQYCDGLGRPDILVTDGLNPNGKNAYYLTEYDYKSLVFRTWLPAVEGNSVNWKSPVNIKVLSKSTNQDLSPYSTVERDALDREVSVCGPGQKWHSAQKHVNTMRYINVTQGDYNRVVKRYMASTSGNTLTENGVWPEGTLTIESTSDEDGKAVMVFTDFLGQKILERRISDDNSDTYFVYNDYGQLRYVLSPMYQEEEDLEKYAYEYRYDNCSRCIYKRLPGCQPVRYWYDDMDQMIFMQDGELLGKSRCRFMLYDNMGRLAVSGTCGNTPQNYPRGTVTHTNSGICGTGYNCIASISLSSPELEAAYYYDNYNFFTDYAFSNYSRISEMQKNDYHNATGLQTGGIVKASEGELLYNAFYYTEKGLVCDLRQSQLGGKLLLTRTDYSFTDKPTRTVYELRQTTRTDSIVVENCYSGNNDALLTTSVSYNGGAAHQVKDLEYDDLGRLTSNTLPGQTGSITYSYDIRDAVTSIQSDKYTEEISYEGLYNGNIAGIENIYAGDTFTNEYTFTYDGMNRLTQAYTTNNNAYLEEAGYDLNGNISELVRAGKHNDGTYKMTDALIYSYNGNQIHSIQDAGGALVYDGSFDFKPSGSTEAYRFNANGAMTYDPNKGFTINYSDWGSPSSITFDSGNSTEYIYGADGRKLKVSWSSNSANCKPTSRFYDDEEEPGSGSGGNTGVGSQGSTTGNIVSNSMEYVGPFIIIEDSLSRIRFDGGYCTINGNQAEYHYYIKDHLGSNRIVVDENGNVEQKNYYYPFGGVYGDISTNTDVQSYKYNGKELDHRHGLDLYDYGARMYDPAVGSWTTPDPLAEKYYNVSPYAYCHNNPVMYVDPDGRETHVAMNGDGKYSVIGGVLNKDRNIYVYSKDKNGNYTIRGKSIGITTSTTSFYNSDYNNGKGAWMVGAIMDPQDTSGKNFLNNIISEDVTLIDYMYNARNNHPYDFKVTNGQDNLVSMDSKYIYRGMIIGKTVSGQFIYSSARDIGNIAAGIVAAKNGIPWAAARIAFDLYQGGIESLSTRNAEFYGWSKTYVQSNGLTESMHIRHSISNFLNKVWTNFKKIW